MIDLGEKYPKETALPAPGGVENRIHYPYLTVNKDIGLDDTDVGKTITAKVTLKVKEVSKRQEAREGQKAKKTERVEFDVLAIGIDKKDFADTVEEGIKR